MIAGGKVTQEQLRKFEDGNQPWRDQIWTDAAAGILRKHKPNLLLLHLLDLDETNHTYGPMSSASFTAMALLDTRVKQIVDTIQRAGLARRTTLMIVSDHGFRPILDVLHPDVLLRDNGVTCERNDQAKSSACVVSKGGIAMVYVAKRDQNAELSAELRNIFSAAEGVDHVYATNEFASIGFPLPSASDQAPDLVLIAKPDYAFTSKEGKSLVAEPNAAGTHGYNMPV